MPVDSDEDDPDERSHADNVKRRKIEKGLSRDNILKPSNRVQGDRESEVTCDNMRPTTRSRLQKGKKGIEYSAKHHPMDDYIRLDSREMRTPRSKRNESDTGHISAFVGFEVRKLGEQMQQTFLRYMDEMQALLHQQDKIFRLVE